MYKTNKINDIDNKMKIPKINGGNKKHKYYDLFKYPFFRLFICASTNSGKTTLIYNILRNIINKKVKVFFYCSTINIDKTYEFILNMLSDRDIEYITYEEINSNDDGININNLQIEIKDLEVDSDNFNKLENIFIFDDLSTSDLSDNVLNKFLRTARHYKAAVIISSQYITNLNNSGKMQLDYIILLGNISKDNLRNIHRACSLGVDFEDFYNIYIFATQNKYDFLFIDRRNLEFRKNFSNLINI